jgi:hypothetical protein
VTVNVTWYYCSGNHCGLHGGGGPEDGLDAVAAAAGGGLPELRQRLLDVVDALQRHVRPWHQRRAPHLHAKVTMHGGLPVVSISCRLQNARTNDAGRRNRENAHDDGAETGGLPCGDVARAVVKEHLRRCEGYIYVREWWVGSGSVESRWRMEMKMQASKRALWFGCGPTDVLVPVCYRPYRSLGVELGDLDDGFHGRQRGLAQDRPSTATTVLLGLGWWSRVEGLEADDPLEAVLEAELLQDSGRVGLVGVGEDLHIHVVARPCLLMETNKRTNNEMKRKELWHGSLTIFLCGRESSSCLSTGSGFTFSYGSVPCTQAWKSS